MEEDIKMLEERVNFCKNNKECREELKECFGCTFSARELSAIENIINHNKKLDIENKELKEPMKKLVKKYYIPKSKIEDKIEYLDKNYSEFSEYPIVKTKQVLQELLEEE